MLFLAACFGLHQNVLISDWGLLKRFNTNRITGQTTADYRCNRSQRIAVSI